MLAAFLGGWEILLLLAVAAAIGVLFVVTLLVVLLANLQKFRGKKIQPPSMQPTGQ